MKCKLDVFDVEFGMRIKLTYFIYHKQTDLYSHCTSTPSHKIEKYQKRLNIISLMVALMSTVTRLYACRTNKLKYTNTVEINGICVNCSNV